MNKDKVLNVLRTPKVPLAQRFGVSPHSSQSLVPNTDDSEV